jgi:Domain of unknown function (DUF4173)
MDALTLPRRNAVIVKLALAALVVILGDWLFWQQSAYGSGIGAFAAGVAAIALLARPAIMASWTGRIAWVTSVLFAAALVYEPSIIGWLSFGVSLGIAILAPRTDGFDDAWAWFQRIVWQTMTAPFLPLLDLAKLMRVRLRRPSLRGRVSARRILGTLILPVTGACVFLLLFASANPVIDHWLNQWNLSGFVDLLHPFRLFLAGIWLLTAWNAMRPRLGRRLIPSFDGTGDVTIAGVSVASVTLSLILFNALFAIQNAMDIAWLWGLMPLPDGLTLAEYAHRGAYPLIVTALLAGLFVLITLRPGSQTAAVPLIRVLVTLWVMQNIILVASSMLRTIDYIEAYSLTILRIAALEWMALVALGLVLILWRLWAEKSGRWLINTNAAAAALVLGAATIVDYGAIAARWNVEHAREIDGTGAQLDLCYLNTLDGAALLPLIELEGRARIDPDLRLRVTWVRQQVMDRMNVRLVGNGWTLRDRSRMAEAQEVLSQRPATPRMTGYRRCDGTIVPPAPPASMPPAPPSSSIDNALDNGEPTPVNAKPQPVTPATNSGLTAEPRP